MLRFATFNVSVSVDISDRIFGFGRILKNDRIFGIGRVFGRIFGFGLGRYRDFPITSSGLEPKFTPNQKFFLHAGKVPNKVSSLFPFSSSTNGQSTISPPLWVRNTRIGYFVGMHVKSLNTSEHVGIGIGKKTHNIP